MRLESGDTVKVYDAKHDKFEEISRNGDVYFCTCPGYRFMNGNAPPNERSCRHLDEFHGKKEELLRVKEAHRRNKAAQQTIENSQCPARFRLIRQPKLLKEAIHQIATCKRVWLDIEVADFRSESRRLSILQAIPDSLTAEADEVLMLDLLGRPKLIELFVCDVMANKSVEKIFHNKAYDLQFLSHPESTHVTCTLELARAIRMACSLPKSVSLASLAEHFELAPQVDKSVQQSDWGRRPLTDKQMQYAAKDVIYLKHIHARLEQLRTQAHERTGLFDK